MTGIIDRLDILLTDSTHVMCTVCELHCDARLCVNNARHMKESSHHPFGSLSDKALRQVH